MAKPHLLTPPGLSSEAKVIKTDSRVFDCTLSSSEVLERTRELGALRKEHQQVCDRLDLAKEEKKDLEGKMDDLAEEIGTHTTRRAVPTEEWGDPATGEAVTVRTDTGEVLSRRTLSPQERQGSLFG